jgi:2-polyprenyl-3-methyl-5-hydroxy-6-metoxy-1,4-benzoquinol methylase
MKAVLPVRLRRFLRRQAREAPARIRDLPPPGLRARVGGLSRTEFALVGREGSAAILRAFETTRRPGREYARWLDFGCGCGRIARCLTAARPLQRLSGVDVDASQIRWARRHLPGDDTAMDVAPPLAFKPESFDVIYAISIFTHLDEREQFAWLEELRRILAPGGLLIATTHGPSLSQSCPGLTPADLALLAERGFLAVDPGGTFNERSTFRSSEYLSKAWARDFFLRAHEPHGFIGYQDLSVWEKR